MRRVILVIVSSAMLLPSFADAVAADAGSVASVGAYSQESDSIVIPRSFGSIELGEYLTERMVTDSFGLEVRYRTDLLYDIIIHTISTPVTYFGSLWDEISIDKSRDEYTALSVSFTVFGKDFDDLIGLYNRMKDDLSDKWGGGKETSYGLSEVTVMWDNSKTVCRLCARVREDIPVLTLSFIDKT